MKDDDDKTFEFRIGIGIGIENDRGGDGGTNDENRHHHHHHDDGGGDDNNDQLQVDDDDICIPNFSTPLETTHTYDFTFELAILAHNDDPWNSEILFDFLFSPPQSQFYCYIWRSRLLYFECAKKRIHHDELSTMRLIGPTIEIRTIERGIG